MKCQIGYSRWVASSGLRICVVTPAPSIVSSATAAARLRPATSAQMTSEAARIANGRRVEEVDEVERVVRARKHPQPHEPLERPQVRRLDGGHVDHRQVQRGSQHGAERGTEERTAEHRP